MTETTTPAVNYVTGKNALSDSMVSLLEYLAAQQYGVRYLKGVNVAHQYTWFRENRITARTWKALEDRGLIESPGHNEVIKHGSNMAVLTAEGYRALFSFTHPDGLLEAVLDSLHADAMVEDLERRAAALGVDEIVTEDEVAELIEAATSTERDVCRKLALANGWKFTEEGARDFGDAWQRKGRTLAVLYAIPGRPEPEGSVIRGMVGTWNRPTSSVEAVVLTAWGGDTIRFRTFAEFAEHVTGKTMADAADALLDDRAADEVPEWGTEPEHAVQAVWGYRATFGTGPTRETITRAHMDDYTVEEEALDQAVALGWLERREHATLTRYEVVNRVVTLAMLKAAERAKNYSVAVLDSRVLTADPDSEGDGLGAVTRLTIGTRVSEGVRRWVLVRERVSPTTLEMVTTWTREYSGELAARYELTSRVASLIGWGWSQAFRRTGDGVTTY